MAKCPRCLERKAKRPCPALGAEICPVCCAEGRLVSIACPTQCGYLVGEHYQHRRRAERAETRGRALLDLNEKLFGRSPQGEFAFKLEADIYYSFREDGILDDARTAKVLETLGSVFSPIFVPDTEAVPLSVFLRERLADRRRYPAGKLEVPLYQRTLRELARHVASLSSDGSHSFADTLSGFFDCLDFEADLDYSPLDASRSEPAPGDDLHRRPSGLIVP